MEEKHLIDHFLEKYRTNQLTAAEYRHFVELINTLGPEMNEPLEAQAAMDWNPSKDILHRIQREEKRVSRRGNIRRWAWSSAAAIALLCMTWFVWPQRNSENLVFQTGFSETQNFELPDGSKVLLNANSSLTWQSDWKQTNQRQVVLQGEAYFDVTKVKGVPFEVQAADIKVHVLGTEFNVRNRESDAEVFLHEGKVDLQISSMEPKKLIMKPGDFVRYDKQDQKISVTEHEQMDRKAAWVDGMLTFENKKVALILKEFQDLYGKEFIIENPDLANRRMDFSLPYADWALVRKALEIAIDAKFTTNQDTIIVK